MGRLFFDKDIFNCSKPHNDNLVRVIPYSLLDRHPILIEIFKLGCRRPERKSPKPLHLLSPSLMVNMCRLQSNISIGTILQFVTLGTPLADGMKQHHLGKICSKLWVRKEPKTIGLKNSLLSIHYKMQKPLFKLNLIVFQLWS